MRRLERLERRHLDAVGAGRVAGALAAVADVEAQALEPRLAARVALVGVDVGDFGHVLLRQAVDLVGVEDGVDAPDVEQHLALVAELVGLGLLRGLGEHDVCGALALAHLGADGLRLAVGHPERRGVAGLDGRAPEDEHVDALVGHGVLAQRLRDLAVGIDGPGLVPGQHALGELGADLRCDLVVEVVDAGHGRFSFESSERRRDRPPGSLRPVQGRTPDRQGRRPPEGPGLAAGGPGGRGSRKPVGSTENRQAGLVVGFRGGRPATGDAQRLVVGPSRGAGSVTGRHRVSMAELSLSN